MNRTRFRSLFDAVAARHAATPLTKTTWSCNSSMSDECVVLFDLQQSSFAKKYYVNISIFARGVRTPTTASPEELVAALASRVAFRGFPPAYDAAFDLTTGMSDEEREAVIEDSFHFLDHFAKQAKTRAGLRALGRQGVVLLPPATCDALDAVDNHGGS